MRLSVILVCLGFTNSLVDAMPLSPQSTSSTNADSAVDDIIKAIHSGLMSRIDAAVDASRSFTFTRKQLEPLVLQLQNGNKSVRALTAEVLGHIGSGAKEAVPALIARVSDANEKVRRSIAYALGAIGDGSTESIKTLCHLLEDVSRETRGSAAWALGRVGRQEKETVAALKTMAVRDSERCVRAQAASALWRVTGDSQTAVRIIVEVLETGTASEQVLAAGLVGEIGEEAHQAVNALIKVLNSQLSTFPDPEVVRALGRIGPKSATAVPSLVAAMTRDNRKYQSNAGRAIGQIGEASIPYLRGLLVDPDQSIRIATIETLTWFGGLARSALPDLARALERETDPPTQLMLRTAIQRIRGE